MSELKEGAPPGIITEEEQAEGLEFRGPDEQLESTLKLQGELAFRQRIIHQYSDMLKGMSAEERTAAINNLMKIEREKQQEVRQKEFGQWYQRKLDKHEDVAVDPEERFEQFLKEMGEKAV
jgi:hypothetical protein